MGVTFRPDALSAEVLVESKARLGEGPSWDDERQRLLWVDIAAGVIHSTTLDGATSSIEVGNDVSAVVPTTDGQLLAAMRNGLRILDEDGVPLAEWAIEEDCPRQRMNDAKCDPEGNLWAGTMADDWRNAPSRAALYVLDGYGRVERVLGGVTLSNGLAWSRDPRRMYYIDSATRRVDILDIRNGTLAGRRTAFVVPDDAGMPDGMTIDHEGCLWVALWGGGGVHRYAPDGVLLARVEVPVAHVTSCCFGGPHGDLLFITTAAEGAATAERHAGSVFICRPGISGDTAVPYRGAFEPAVGPRGADG